MKNIYSNIIKFNSKNLIKIIKILKKNGIIGLPTETVYGLAGNAYSNDAIKKIFNVKKRLRKNPLIIHYYNLNHAKKDVELDKKFYTLNDYQDMKFKLGDFPKSEYYYSRAISLPLYYRL